MISKFFKGMSKPKLLLKLGYLLKQMKKVNNLYLKYPQDINGYNTWQELENDLFSKVYLKIICDD